MLEADSLQLAGAKPRPRTRIRQTKELHKEAANVKNPLSLKKIISTSNRNRTLPRAHFMTCAQSFSA
jgi:hypothetical protein